VGWLRSNLDWISVEAVEGQRTWNASDLQRAVAARSAGLRYLPMLISTGGDWTGPHLGPPTNTTAWVAFVTEAVVRCRALGVTHFQVWNEPTRAAGFFNGTDEQFIDLVYLPAARAIRRQGGKVVFGGWPGSNSLAELNQVLRYQDAYTLTDVIDTHYRSVENWASLANWSALPRGPSGLWQTEVSPSVPPDSSDMWMAEPNRLPNKFLRAIYWAVTAGNWSEPDQYKFFWFATGHAAGPRGFSNTCLSVGTEEASNLTIHGAHLRTMASVLNGSFHSAFSGFHTVPPLAVSLDEANSTALGFRMQEDNGQSDTVVLSLLLRHSAFLDGALQITLDKQALPHGTAVKWARLVRSPVAISISLSNYSVLHPAPIFLDVVGGDTVTVHAQDLVFDSVSCSHCDGPHLTSAPFGPIDMAVAFIEIRTDWTACSSYFTDFAGDGNCRNILEIFHPITSKACRDACDAHINCTAVNYNTTAGGCVLRSCKEGTQPRATGLGVVGLSRYDVNCSSEGMPLASRKPVPVVGVGTTTPTFPESPVDPPARWVDESLGDIRAVLEIEGSAAESSALVAVVEWRRRDLIPGPEESAYALSCSNSTHQETFLSNAVRISSNRSIGVLAFAPACGAGNYYVYPAGMFACKRVRQHTIV
jgi:hypothetical protein